MNFPRRMLAWDDVWRGAVGVRLSFLRRRFARHVRPFVVGVCVVYFGGFGIWLGANGVRTFRGKYVECQFPKTGWGPRPARVLRGWSLFFSFQRLRVLVVRVNRGAGFFVASVKLYCLPIVEVGDAFVFGPVCFVVGMRSSICAIRC